MEYKVLRDMAMVIEDFSRILWDFPRISRGAVALLHPSSYTSV